jgi:hypothetical protein
MVSGGWPTPNRPPRNSEDGVFPVSSGEAPAVREQETMNFSETAECFASKFHFGLITWIIVCLPGPHFPIGFEKLFQLFRGYTWIVNKIWLP